MIRWKWTFTILVFVGLMGVAGCSGKTTKEVELEKQVELERQIDQTETEVSEETEVKLPAVIHLIDPNTKQTVKTIVPEDIGYETDSDIYKKEMEKIARELARGTETEVGYDRRMILDKMADNGSIIKGTPMIMLEESELVEKIIAASEDGGDIELPIYVVESGYKLEDAASLKEVVVASYTTYYNSSVAGRTKNIELSADAIHNVIVGVGDHFSFNTTVGPSDEAHGYQPAEEAINGKLVMGIGGGICQTSSTLFNAVDQLGVSYIEKHHHSVTVGYVPRGRDATVSYGGLDFRLQNTTGAPFLITTVYGNGALTVEIRTATKYADLINKSI